MKFQKHNHPFGISFACFFCLSRPRFRPPAIVFFCCRANNRHRPSSRKKEYPGRHTFLIFKTEKSEMKKSIADTIAVPFPLETIRFTPCSHKICLARVKPIPLSCEPIVKNGTKYHPATPAPSSPLYPKRSPTYTVSY